MICLIWNCQGAASNLFRRTLKHFSRVYSPSIVCLLETKVSGSHANTICSSFGFEEWIRVEAVGFSRGIWILWKNTLTVHVIETHPQFITLKVEDSEVSTWFLTVVYGSPEHQLRKRLFSALSHQSLPPQAPWLIAGDFNSVTCQDEISNPTKFSAARCSDFNRWIFQEALLDLGFVGTKFTWMRGLNTESFKGARLDRALSNVEWRAKFPNASFDHLPIIGSDHAPLLLNTMPSTQLTSNKGFRFNAAWTTHTSFLNLVQCSWNANISMEDNLSKMAEALQ